MSEPILEAQGLWHERGDRELYAGLDIALHPGEIVQVRGPNGHGKSTLLRILAGLIVPDQGQRQWKGAAFRSWVDEPVAPIFWHGESAGWSRSLNVAQNWRYLCALRGLPPGQPCGWADPAWSGRPHGMLSTGQRKRLELAFVEQSQAAVWLLDEPLSGLDVDNSREWQHRMRRAADAGIAIAVVSHEAVQGVDRVCDWEAPC
ncbi:MAG: ABC transporter ATP-binding protein [Oceanococcaceae bacterium]